MSCKRLLLGVVALSVVALMPVSERAPGRAQGLPIRAIVPQVACDGCVLRTTPVIVVAGQADAVALAKPLLAGLPVQYDGAPQPFDPVLFVVSAADGPMPQTRERIDVMAANPHARDALLVVKAAGSDAELLQLVVLEMRELLQTRNEPHAASMPLLLDTHANIRMALRGLLYPTCGPCAPQLPEIVVAGQADAVEFAKPLLEGLPVRYEGTPRPGDALLFVVSAQDGPMPQTRQRIEEVAALPHKGDAILVVREALVNDPDLLALVILEMRQLLAASGEPHWDAMPVIVDTEATAILALRGLLIPAP